MLRVNLKESSLIITRQTDLDIHQASADNKNLNWRQGTVPHIHSTRNTNKDFSVDWSSKKERKLLLLLPSKNYETTERCSISFLVTNLITYNLHPFSQTSHLINSSTLLLFSSLISIAPSSLDFSHHFVREEKKENICYADTRHIIIPHYYWCKYVIFLHSAIVLFTLRPATLFYLFTFPTITTFTSL